MPRASLLSNVAYDVAEQLWSTLYPLELLPMLSLAVDSLYAATFVITIAAEHDMHHTVHLPTFLLYATTPAHAYEQAQTFGPRLNDAYRNDAGNVVRMTYCGIHTIERLADNNTFPAALQWQIGNHEPIEVSTVRLVDLSSTAIDQLVATKEILDSFD